GGALVRVITNRGQLVVEVDDPDVEIVVKQGGATVVDHQKDRQYELTAAEGDVDLYEAASGVRLVTKHFRLERGGRTVVDARMDVAAAKAAPKPASTATAAVRHADREKPFVVVGKNGSRREYKHCTAALAVLQPGDSVEVLGNGPFKLPAIRLDGRSLTLRAGSGYRPVFVPAADVTGPWITVHNAPLRLVGCDFHRYAGPALQGSGRWKIDGCRLVSALYGEGAVIEFHGPKLTVQNCLMTQMIACDDCVQVELVNNLIHSAVQILSLSNGGGQTIHLQGNTVLTEREVIRLHADAATRPVQIRAEGNLWCGPRLVWASDNVTASNFHWQGRDNLYVAMSSFVGNELGVRVKDLKEWARFCGLSELGSQAVADVRFGWDEVAAKGLDGGLPLLRQRIAMIKQRHGLAELGPHWEWIGPGEAYVRALTAAHDPRAQAPQRPEPPETGPVVLIRGDKMVRGYTDLQQAFNAAGDGDVVELGTDGPLAGASIAGQRKLALTIRAAPGYRPVVEGDLVFQSAVRVSIEGLDFRKGTVDYRYGYGRLVRLANCAFDTQDARHLVGMMIDDQGERPTEVVNCWLPGVWAFRPSLKHIAIIRNSVVGPCAEMSRRSDGAVGIRVEQCVLWNPGLGRPPEPDSAGAVRRHPEPRLDMDVHRSLVEAGYLANTWDNFSWKGIQTAYCTDDDNLLAHLTTQGSREDGSVVDAPLEWDPAQWRLLPGQPKRSDGHDYGAEVRRVLD
ncbi:MAG TPA: hypothetical protein VFA18_02910, partial [Gemmataceae bacterium]|nr:hypothetical protein [Gemmataceae bacterium]